MAEHEDAAAGGLHHRALLGGQILHGIVAAFYVNIRRGGLQEIRGAQFVKNENGVHGLECGHHGGAVGLGVNGPVMALQLAHGAVAVQPHQQRIGFGARAVVTGDVSQIDLPKGAMSGLIDAERVLKRVKGIAVTRFTSADVVRHPLVARIVDAYDAQRSRRGAGE